VDDVRQVRHAIEAPVEDDETKPTNRRRSTVDQARRERVMRQAVPDALGGGLQPGR
jgi:hypothetical protein